MKEEVLEKQDGLKKKNIKKKIILTLIILVVAACTSFVIYEIATRNNTYYIGEKNLQIPIFVYHNIVKDETEIQYEYMQTTVDIFEKQITGLMKLGYKPISYQDLVEYKAGEMAIPKWSFLITFDDGCSGVYEYAFDIAKKYNIPMTSFVIDQTLEKDGGTFTWAQAKEMHDSGLISIYSHGYQHLEYDKQDSKDLVSQTNQAYEDLKAKLQDENILKVFTYPYGLYNMDDINALADEGYIQNLTDNKVNESKNLNLSMLHRCYPLSDSVFKILLKINYRIMRYGSGY
jgi:peptidoglycan/xylan/chitin deacetylase (PgdA/CDA1 family)